MEKFLSCILIGTFDSSEESHILSLLNFIENCKASDFFVTCDTELLIKLKVLINSKFMVIL